MEVRRRCTTQLLFVVDFKRTVYSEHAGNPAIAIALAAIDRANQLL